MTFVIPSRAVWRDAAAMLPPGSPLSSPQSCERLFAPFRLEHARMLARIDELEALVGALHDGVDEALVLDNVGEIERQFATHMTAEDSVLFPALAGAFPEACGTLQPLSSDHDVLRSLLGELSALLAAPPGPARDEHLGVATRDFVDLLRLHIRREELVVFQVACRVLTERDFQELGRRLGELREGKGGAPSAA